jgi:hypothetical protein
VKHDADLTPEDRDDPRILLERLNQYSPPFDDTRRRARFVQLKKDIAHALEERDAAIAVLKQELRARP